MDNFGKHKDNKFWWLGRRITKTPTFCLTCGKDLKNRKPGQIQKYCDKRCRKARSKK